ncbi:MAG: hypothetical protein J7L53_11040 [Deltaproteobacteria bacterium]|nr:hypothetical protein [Deltaproteobacteria bacterium]
MQYDDKKAYEFHTSDSADKCFLCKKHINKLLVVRQIATMKMVHLCPECMVNNLSDYLLDNTRPWKETKISK